MLPDTSCDSAISVYIPLSSKTGILTFNEYCSWSLFQYVTSMINFWCIHDTYMMHLLEAWTKATLSEKRNYQCNDNWNVKLKVNCKGFTSWCHMKELSKCWRTICVSLNRPSRSRVMKLWRWVGESSLKLENVVFQLLELPITAENDVIIEQ